MLKSFITLILWNPQLIAQNTFQGQRFLLALMVSLPFTQLVHILYELHDAEN